MKWFLVLLVSGFVQSCGDVSGANSEPSQISSPQGEEAQEDGAQEFLKEITLSVSPTVEGARWIFSGDPKIEFTGDKLVYTFESTNVEFNEAIGGKVVVEASQRLDE